MANPKVSSPDPSPSGRPHRWPLWLRAELLLALVVVTAVIAVGSFAYLTVGPGHRSRHCPDVQVATGRC